MKKIIRCIILAFSSYAYAQVGIGTDTPQAMLHVNGSTQLSKDLKVGSSKNPGEVNQILFSNGPNKAPSWKDVDELVIPTEVSFFKKSIPTNNIRFITSSTDIIPSNGHIVTFNEQVYNNNEFISPILTNGFVSSFRVNKTGTYSVIGFTEITRPTDYNESTILKYYLFKNNQIAAGTSVNLPGDGGQYLENSGITAKFSEGDILQFNCFLFSTDAIVNSSARTYTLNFAYIDFLFLED